MTAPGTPFGTPLPAAPRSLTSTLIVEPTIGFDLSRSALNIAAGATPNSDNFIMREGRLEPRPMLSRVTDSANVSALFGDAITGGIDITSTDGDHYIVATGRHF